jgi:hypothetical protein
LLTEEITFLCEKLQPFLKESTLLPREVVFLPEELIPFLNENLVFFEKLFFLLVQVVFQNISFVL